MLPQNPLRFLLADDAGAGKTVMTGLYIREMINRGRLRRVIICCPAGLTWNWQRELRDFFDLDFRILRGQDFPTGDPLTDEHGLFIISVDTAATEPIRERLQNLGEGRFDLVVCDEANKLSWTDSRRLDSKTRRYRLAETMAKCTHLLLLTATPHMGKAFPYFALWRLLDANIFSTLEALGAVAQEKRRTFFIRRLKEEMIDYRGQPIYKPRLCQTVKFELSKPEQDFYEGSSEYLRWSFETNRSLNRNAAAMVVAVLQRREDCHRGQGAVGARFGASVSRPTASSPISPEPSTARHGCSLQFNNPPVPATNHRSMRKTQRKLPSECQS